jgi:fibronectin-binding autotransporter adhesin
MKLPWTPSGLTVLLLSLLGLINPKTKLLAYTYSESFTGTTASGWTAYQQGAGPGPRLTAGTTAGSGDPETGTIDTAGQGWLRMTNLTQQQANSFVFDSAIAASNNTFTINFEVAMWNKNGSGAADGITFFMYDASQNFSPGATGGSMGYAQKIEAQGGESDMQGVPGGYFGVGIDNFGNFANPTEGRIGGGGSNPNSVGVRGPGSVINSPGSPLDGGWYGGYEYLAGTGGVNTTQVGNPAIPALSTSLDFPNATTRPNTSGADYRAFQITLDANNDLTIELKSGISGTYQTLFTAESLGARPQDLRFGFAAGTGGAAQVLEIRNFAITTTSANSWVWDNGSGPSNRSWGNSGGPNNYQNNWDQNTNPTTLSGVTPDVIFDNQYVTSAQTITVRDTNKTVNNIYFGGQYGYTLNGSSGTRTIFLDNGTNTNASIIGLYNNLAGNANHAINTRITAQNNVIVENLTSQTLSFGNRFTIGSNALTVNTTGTVSMTSLLGSGTVTKTGSGSYILSAANTSFTGNTVINAGTLQMGNARALGSSGSGSVTVNSGGTLALSNTGTVATKALTLNGSGAGGDGALNNVSGTNTWAGTVNLASTSTVGVSAGQLTISGAISGSGGLTKAGPNTLILTGNNTFTGTTTVNAGTLNLNGSGSNKALGGTSEVVINSGGTVLFSKANQINSVANMTLNGGTLNTAGFAQTLNTMTFSTNSTLILGGTTLTLTDLVRTGGILNVDNYTFNGQFVAAPGSVDQNTLNNIYFVDQGIMGAFQLSNGYIVPVPEPGTYSVAGLLGLLLAYDRYKRKRLNLYSPYPFHK